MSLAKLPGMITPPGVLPEIITLCGSTRFADEWARVNRALGLDGRIVISVSLFGHQEGLDMTGPEKAKLDHLHLWKISISDAVFIINPGGYVGESTRREIDFACKAGKRFYWLDVSKIVGDFIPESVNGLTFYSEGKEHA